MADAIVNAPPTMLGAAWIVARKDLAIEFRTRTAFLSAVVFALLGVTIFYFAWDSTAVAASDLAPGVLWVIFIFAALLGLQRSFGRQIQCGGQPTNEMVYGLEILAATELAAPFAEQDDHVA